MISAATFDELAGYAARGRIGSVIDLRCSNPYPEVESEVSLDWESSADGVLEIVGGGRLAVPANGQRRIAVGVEPVTVRLTVDGEVAEILIQPRIFVPSAELRVPNRITLGVASRVTWHSDAETCTLRLIDGDGVQEESCGPSGGIDFVARNLGELRIELDARGRHAHLSPLIGIATQSEVIQVLAPPVVIFVDAREQTALIGDEVTFSWNVSGARGGRVEALERNEVFSVPVIGHLVAEVGSQPERFRIVATGLDGAEEFAEFRLVPRMLDVSYMPRELNYLNLPWE